MAQNFYLWLRETGSLFVRYVLVGFFAIPFAVVSFFAQRGSHHGVYISVAFVAASFAFSFVVWSRFQRNIPHSYVSFSTFQQQPVIVDEATLMALLSGQSIDDAAEQQRSSQTVSIAGGLGMLTSDYDGRAQYPAKQTDELVFGNIGSLGLMSV